MDAVSDVQEAAYSEAEDWPADYDEAAPHPIVSFRIPDTDTDRLWIVCSTAGLPVHLSADLESATAARLTEKAMTGSSAEDVRLDVIALEG